MADQTKNLAALLLIAAIALFLALLPIWPYGYFTLLRVLICGVSVYGFLLSKDFSFLKKHMIAFIVIAVLFNPLVPIHLSRAIWVPIDLGVAIYFIMLIKRLKQK